MPKGPKPRSFTDVAITAPLLIGEGNRDENGNPILQASGFNRLAKKRGRPKHMVTDQTRKNVEELSAFGLTHDQISRVMGISDETLRRYYRPQLEVGLSRKNAEVAGNLYRIATNEEHKDSVRAAIFWLSQRGGPDWQRANRTELTGPNGAPLQVEQARTIDSRNLSYDDRQALREILMRATAGESERPVIEHQNNNGDNESDNEAESDEPVYE